MSTLANSEDPDEMQHNAAFHQGLHCFLSLKQPSGTEIHHNLENSTCDHLKGTAALKANESEMQALKPDTEVCIHVVEN